MYIWCSDIKGYTGYKYRNVFPEAKKELVLRIELAFRVTSSNYQIQSDSYYRLVTSLIVRIHITKSGSSLINRELYRGLCYLLSGNNFVFFFRGNKDPRTVNSLAGIVSRGRISIQTGEPYKEWNRIKKRPYQMLLEHMR